MVPRTSRSIAQRYAAASRKRRKATQQGASPAAEAAQGSAKGDREPISTPPGPAARASIKPAVAAEARPARKSSVDLAEQYRYVWMDIRRVGIISGGLLLALILLSFVLR